MPAVQRTRRPRPQAEQSREWVLLALLIVGNVIQATRLYDVFWSDASRFAYLAQGIVIAIFLALAFYRRHWSLVGVAIVVGTTIVYSHLNFVNISGAVENFNIVATYLPLLTFVAFVESKVPVERILKMLLIVSTTYVFTYVLLEYVIRTYYATQAKTVLLPGHAGNDIRVYVAAAYCAFVIFYAFCNRTLHPVMRGLMVVAGVVALWLSDTRAMILIVAAVFTLGVTNLLIRPTRVAILFIVLFGMFLMCAGFIFSDWNPYFLFTSDPSGSYRAIEYDWTIRILRHNFFVGIGIPGEPLELQLFLRSHYEMPRNLELFASDLGVLGVWFQFGVLGVVAFVAAIVMCMIGPWTDGDPGVQALQFTAFTCSVYGVTSPMLMVEPTSVFLCLVVAIWARNRRRQRLLRQQGGLAD